MTDHSEMSDDDLLSTSLDAEQENDDIESKAGQDHYSDSSIPRPPTIGGLIATTTKTTMRNSGDQNYGNKMETSDGDASAVSSLSGGVVSGRSIGLSKHADPDDSTSKHDPSPLFQLGAPQILDEDDSDLELEEDQQPSQPFIKDWEDDPDLLQQQQQQQQQPVDSGGGSSTDFHIEASARRQSNVRRSKRVSHAWGDVSISRRSGSFGQLEFGIQHELIADDNNNDEERQSPAATQPQKVDRKDTASKIVQRMKEGMKSLSTSHITDYHDASTRTGSGRPKYSVDVRVQSLEKDRLTVRILYFIGAIICLLVVALVVVVVVLLIQNATGNNESDNSLDNSPPTVAPTPSPI